MSVDLGSNHVIDSVVTQGCSNIDEWVTRYMISYGLDGSTGQTYVKGASGSVAYFDANR